MDERRLKVRRLKKQIEKGAYCVDPSVVAEAVMDRMRAAGDLDIEELVAGWSAMDEYQTECSYPRSSVRLESPKRTRGVPARTRPIQVSASLQLRTAASATWRALGGTQTHSS